MLIKVKEAWTSGQNDSALFIPVWEKYWKHSRREEIKLHGVAEFEELQVHAKCPLKNGGDVPVVDLCLRKENAVWQAEVKEYLSEGLYKESHLLYLVCSCLSWLVHKHKTENVTHSDIMLVVVVEWLHQSTDLIPCWFTPCSYQDTGWLFASMASTQQQMWLGLRLHLKKWNSTACIFNCSSMNILSVGTTMAWFKRKYALNDGIYCKHCVSRHWWKPLACKCTCTR